MAKSYSVPHVAITAALRPDGSLLVTERRTFRFEGNFSHLWQVIELPERSLLQGFSLRDEQGEYQPDTSGQPHTYTIGRDSSGWRVDWYVQAADTESRGLAREPGEFSMTAKQEHDYICGRLADPLSLFLIAEVDGAIVSTTNVQPVRNLSRFRHRALLAVAVRSAYWRLGLGRLMMTEALRWCKAAGYEQAELDVVASNEAAIALYESLGFETTGSYKRGFKYSDGTYADEYFMWLPLDRIR
jgi:ribosomal protein S18 acetylase RimI-like enzyme